MDQGSLQSLQKSSTISNEVPVYFQCENQWVPVAVAYTYYTLEIRVHIPTLPLF
jgi:hypothetical protein